MRVLGYFDNAMQLGENKNIIKINEYEDGGISCIEKIIRYNELISIECMSCHDILCLD